MVVYGETSQAGTQKGLAGLVHEYLSKGLGRIHSDYFHGLCASPFFWGWDGYFWNAGSETTNFLPDLKTDFQNSQAQLRQKDLVSQVEDIFHLDFPKLI